VCERAALRDVQDADAREERGGWTDCYARGVLTDEDAVRGALESAGWSVRVPRRETAARDRPLDLSVFASRGGLRASIDVARGEAGIRAMSWRRVTPFGVERRFGDTRLIVEVCDYERAREELSAMVLLRELDWARLVGAMAARGWRIDEGATVWNDYDGCGAIHGTRESEALYFEMVYAGPGRSDIRELNGAATTYFSVFFATTTVRSSLEAGALADLLTRER
jgi:hypothetical protein